MRYDDFRDCWHDALKKTGLTATFPLWPTETIDRSTMDRSYSVYLRLTSTPETRPFHVSAKVSWQWDVLLSARFATTEEDMLMQIYGVFGIHEDTDVPWLRVDVTLYATLPPDVVLPMPSAGHWHRWASVVTTRLEPLLPTESNDEMHIFSWSGEPRVNLDCSTTGQLYLYGVELSGWQGVNLPRQWDDPDKWDAEPDEQLRDFAHRLNEAMRVWQESLERLLAED